MYTIITSSENYSVDANGNIGRPRIGMLPSREWKVLALVRRCNFGVIEVIPFAEWATKLDKIQWSFKNGKCRYTLRDLDHGTVREWGNPIKRVFAA